MFLNTIVSTFVFVIFLALGQLFMFLDPFAYWLVPCFSIMALLTYKMYQENCKTLEWKDFVITVFFTVVGYGFLRYQNIDVNFGNVCYLYLSVFMADIMFATSVRYKSLI